MSTPPGPPPYGPPPQPQAARPGKPPPSWWWFLGPVALLLLSGIVFAAMLIWTLEDVTQVDARVPVDGRPHPVSVPTDGDRMLFADAAAGNRPCVVTGGDGRVIEQRDVFGDFTMSRDGREWSGLTRFDPGSGQIVVRCSGATPAPGGPTGEVLITPAHDIGGMVARIAGTILVPMALGGVALLWALILGIVILTRRTGR